MNNASPVVLTHQTLGRALAADFRTGSSILETPQKHPPPVGLPKLGNWGAEGPKELEITPRSDLGTLEAVIARRYALDTGLKSDAPMTFATVNEANIVNVSHGGVARKPEAMVRTDLRGGEAAEKLGFEVRLEEPERGPWVGRIAMHDRAGEVQRDDHGGLKLQTVFQGAVYDPPPRHLYHADDLEIDSKPKLISVEQNHDENGRPVPPKPRAIVRDENGKSCHRNWDADGTPHEGRIGDVQRNRNGDPVMSVVVPLGRDERTIEQQLDRVDRSMNAILDDINDRLEQAGAPPARIETRDECERAELSVEMVDTQTTRARVPTITMPTEFESRNHELTERSRALSHLQQWHSQDGPNHAKAVIAAELPPAKRDASAEFAACELTAQTAALQTVTRAGGTYKPQAKEFNDGLREHWAKQVETRKGLEDFGRATDEATRVCDGNRPTPVRPDERQQSRETKIPVRGAGRPVGGTPAPAAQAQSQSRASRVER